MTNIIQIELNFFNSTPPMPTWHKTRWKKACATTSNREMLNMCPNVCYATQLFPAFSMPLLTNHNTYIKISPCGIKCMHHSTSYPVIPISISGMNISRQNLVTLHSACLAQQFKSALWCPIHVIKNCPKKWPGLLALCNLCCVRSRAASLIRAGWSPLPPSVSSYLAPSAVWILYATLIFSFSTCSAAEPHSLEVGEGGRWTRWDKSQMSSSPYYVLIKWTLIKRRSYDGKFHGTSYDFVNIR